MKNIIAAMLILAFCSCEGLLHFVDNQKCINEEIEAFQKEMEDTCESGAEIIKYEFQDEIVYAFLWAHVLVMEEQEFLMKNAMRFVYWARL